MPEFACGSCGGRLQVLEEHIGQVVACPHCGNHVRTRGGPPKLQPRAASSGPSLRSKAGGRRSARRAGATRSGKVAPPTNGPVILAISLSAILLCGAPIAYLVSMLLESGSGLPDPSEWGRFIVLGLVSCISFPLFITAWVMGNSHRQIARRAAVTPQATAVIGWIFGILGTGAWILQFLYALLQRVQAQV